MRCPECNKDTISLVHTARVVAMWRFSLDQQGDADYSTSELMDEAGENQQWSCPHCDAVLFEDELDATKFLRGEYVPTVVKEKAA
jgi:hypothetical protein